jgi:hypothetical protein
MENNGKKGLAIIRRASFPPLLATLADSTDPPLLKNEHVETN